MSQLTETEKPTAPEQHAGCCHGGSSSHHDASGGGQDHAEGHGSHGHSHWLMIACCVPMLLIAGFLLVGGAGLAAFAPALLCVAMMGLMMLGMSRMHSGH